MYFIIGILLISHLGFSQQDGFVEINTDSVSTEKWKFLENVLEGKKIVALGESLHGVKEYNSTKLELIKYLHEELDFNVLAIESDLAKNYFGNLHKLEIADTIFLKELFTPVWHTQEHLKIVKYLKTKPGLKIIGFDIETKKSVHEISRDLNVSIDSAATQVKFFLEKYRKWKELNGTNRTASVSERDSTMAEVLIWIISDLYPDEKIIVSAHNTHISNVEVRKACMGEILKDNYQNRYYSVGFFHSLGNPAHIQRKMTYENEISKLPASSIWIKEVTHPKYIIPNKFLEK